MEYFASERLPPPSSRSLRQKKMKPKVVMEMSRMLLSEIQNIDTSMMKDGSKMEAAKAELAERLNFFLSTVGDIGAEPTPIKEEPPLNFRRACQQRAKVVLPHVGLVILSLLYTLLGAVVFAAIESPYEMTMKNASLTAIHEFRSQFVQDLWYYSRNGDEQLLLSDYENYIDSRLMNLSTILYYAYEKNYVTIGDIWNGTESQMWSFTSSLFFSATAITAIGYGHLIPHSTEGRVVCLLFCLIGIPLVLVTIADLGRFLSDYIVTVYKYYSNFLHWVRKKLRRCCRKLKLNRRPSSDPDLSTLPKLLMINSTNSRRSNMYKQDDIVATGKVSVLFVLSILIGYTAFGAFIFGFMEDWTFFQGFFYCFTTVTTIGFGDIVPRNQMYIPLTILYIFVGLIITSMCVDLVGSQYIREIHDFGRNIKSITRALSHFEGVNIGEIFSYAAFLQHRFGMNAEQLQKVASLPNDYLLDCLIHGTQPDLNYRSNNDYVPNDIFHIKWIEQPRTLSYVSENVMASTETLDITSRCSTARTPRDWYYHMIYEHKTGDRGQKN